MDATDLVRTLFDAVPVHRTPGPVVRHAVDGDAAVELLTVPALIGEARRELGKVFNGAAGRISTTTAVEVTDDAGAVVCEGTFDWSVRRPRAATRRE